MPTARAVILTFLRMWEDIGWPLYSHIFKKMRISGESPLAAPARPGERPHARARPPHPVILNSQERENVPPVREPFRSGPDATTRAASR
jgi:hypothetical protein